VSPLFLWVAPNYSYNSEKMLQAPAEEKIAEVKNDSDSDTSFYFHIKSIIRQ
jgi:hypothetical protein